MRRCAGQQRAMLSRAQPVVIAIDAIRPATGGIAAAPVKLAYLRHPAAASPSMANKVYFAASEAASTSRWRQTRRRSWTTKVAENKDGYYISSFPLIAGGKVKCRGRFRWQFGIRGFVAGFDP